MKDDGSAKTATSDSPSTPLPSDIPPRFVSLAMGYPRELIQHIYSYLHPRDFNAARHTCQSWMTASLDKTLLKTMLKRAGWSAKDENYIWGMSCRLARECALSSGWTGNGITDSPLTSPFRQSAWTDFSELASGYGSPTTGRGSCGLVFTVSVCGKFLLVAEGGVIYVYELVGDMLRVLTSVICPRKVLAMSMDASSKRFAVAALLDGRMGLMCDLNVRRASAEESRAAALYPGATVESSTGHRESDRNSLFTTRLYPEDDRLSLPQSSTLPHRRETRNQPSDFLDTPYQASPSDYANARRRNPSDSFETADTENPDPIELTASNPPILLEDTSSLAGRFRNHINQSWNLQLTGFPYSPPIVSPGSKDNNRIKPGIPVETGPRSLYRHLCSNEDPPRSVAICPQRQCVAFGCSSGLELHWVDALTGQDLNRWFPLTGPSDFLYFFPPRHGIDSPRKLRLISSTAHPSERASINNRIFAATRPMMRSFWSVVGFEANASPIQTHHRGPFPIQGTTSRLLPWVSDCDHYRAVPLSDGFHVLFVDPESDFLCLGSDAPVGDPRRLLRKAMFVPPKEVEGVVPRLYAAGFNVCAGPRVVVAYGDCLVLYSVPEDVFGLSRREQRAGRAMGEAELADGEAAWLAWWDEGDIPTNRPDPASSGEARAADNVRVGPPKSVWPLLVRGQVLGTVEGLVDIAVNEVEGLAIWGFGADGRAGVWRIDDGIGSGVGLRVVERDGNVVSIPSICVGFGQVGGQSSNERGWAADFVV